MNEIFDQMMFLMGLLGLIAMVVIPLGMLAAFIVDKTLKQPKNTFDAHRQEDNLEILRLLEQYIKKNPEQRLGQAMRNVGILLDVDVSDVCNRYYINRDIIHEEPSIILERVQKTLKAYENE